ncbi:hypothetical protein [Actinacidiphila glaucinigra]
MDSGTVPRTVPVDRMASGDHACLGFQDEDDRWEIRAAFTAIGLARGERVLLLTGPGTPRTRPSPTSPREGSGPPTRYVTARSSSPPRSPATTRPPPGPR